MRPHAPRYLANGQPSSEGKLWQDTTLQECCYRTEYCVSWTLRAALTSSHLYKNVTSTTIKETGFVCVCVCAVITRLPQFCALWKECAHSFFFCFLFSLSDTTGRRVCSHRAGSETSLGCSGYQISSVSRSLKIDVWLLNFHLCGSNVSCRTLKEPERNLCDWKKKKKLFMSRVKLGKKIKNWRKFVNFGIVSRNKKIKK